jgi:predicted NBD/HSP70 family sugar kinase
MINTAKLSLSESEREIMRIVRSNETIARSQITKHTSLSQQSVHRIVEGLVESKLLQPSKAVIKGRGKPSPQVTLNNSSTYTLGVSIRPDNVQLMALNLSGIVLKRTKLKADPNDRDGTLNELRSTIDEWSKNTIFESRVAVGLGVSIQGYRIAKMNEFTLPLPINSWTGIPIDEIFQSALGVTAFTENNATCAAIAEYHGEKNECYRNLAYLSFNFGFGAGLVNDGAAVIGGFGNAGELGNLVNSADMEHRPALGELVKRLNDSGVPINGIPELQQKFDAEWPAVVAWLQEISPTLNLTIAAISAIMNPEVICFGGEAPAALRELLISICKRPPANRYGETLPFPKLLPSRIDGDAAVNGAAILPARQLIF